MEIDEMYKIFSLTDEMVDSFQQIANASAVTEEKHVVYLISTIVLGSDACNPVGEESTNA